MRKLPPLPAVQLIASSACGGGGKVLDRIDAAAAKNAEIRASIAGIFVQDGNSSDPSETLRQISSDCGVSDADMAKLDAA